MRFFAQNGYETGGLQLGHCIGKGPDTGQQDMICRPQIRRIAGHADLRAQTFDAGRKAEQIPHAIVNDCDHNTSPSVYIYPFKISSNAVRNRCI